MCCYIRSKHTHTTAEQKLLYETADKLEREAMEMANELPQDPDKGKMKGDLISHKNQEASKLRDQAARLPQKRYKDLLEKADQKQYEELEFGSSNSKITEKNYRRHKKMHFVKRHIVVWPLILEMKRKMKMRMAVSKNMYESMLVIERIQMQHATAQQTQTQQYKNKKKTSLV